MFDKASGGGITLTNLFSGWDVNNIAVASVKTENPDFSVCKNVYCLGNSEIERGFPFNMKRSDENLPSGVLTLSHSQQEHVLRAKPKIGKFELLKDHIITLTGQIHRRRRFLISNELSKWIADFNPDIIYSQLSSHEIIQFVGKIQGAFNKPLVLHIMDDWPQTITSNQLLIFRLYWSRLIKKELRKMFTGASVLMSISESMSDEYLRRYGMKFYPFHNPVDVNKWTSVHEKEYSFRGSFKILYAGRIGLGLQNCLIDIANAIQNLIKRGLNIEFFIQPTNDNPVLMELARYGFVSIKIHVPYIQLPAIFSSVDLLLLPNDFDHKSVSFLRYSMPTKASEYMVSGTPILIYSNSETAITKHALKHEWAYVVAENSAEKLESAIQELYLDDNLRREIGTRAKEFAITNFDSKIIREKFKNALQNKF